LRLDRQLCATSGQSERLDNAWKNILRYVLSFSVAISGALLPVLEGKGPIALTVGSAEFTLPTTGLTQPLSRFKAICFGSR
jgi:hypothetical protein